MGHTGRIPGCLPESEGKNYWYFGVESKHQTWQFICKKDMPSSYKGYSSESLRLSNWNYNRSAAYFITICTKNKVPFFGEIRKGIIGLSLIGIIAYEEWEKSIAIRPDMNLDLGPFIVMPNHFHAIITIGANIYNEERNTAYLVENGSSGSHNKLGNQFGPQRKNLPAIIRGYKGAVTRRARIINENYSWQSGFYDHIIKTPAAYQRISQYIFDNPVNWRV